MRKVSPLRQHTVEDKGPVERQLCPDGQERVGRSTVRGAHPSRTAAAGPQDHCLLLLSLNKQWLMGTQQQSGWGQRGVAHIASVSSHTLYIPPNRPRFLFQALNFISPMDGLGRTDVNHLHSAGTVFSKGQDVSRRWAPLRQVDPFQIFLNLVTMSRKRFGANMPFITPLIFAYT